MLTHQGAGLRNLSNSDVVSRVLSPSASGRDQQFFAAVFLRLLSVLPKEVHDLDNNLRLGVTRLLEKVPKVAQVLGIDKKVANFFGSSVFFQSQRTRRTWARSHPSTSLNSS